MRTLAIGLALVVVLLLPCTIRAQDTSKASLHLIVGVGLPSGKALTLTPAYAAGFELTPAGSRVAFRLLAESWESQYSSPWGDDLTRSGGVQLLGVRTFGARRIQPYLLAGAGLYMKRSFGWGYRLVWTDSGLYGRDPRSYDRRDVIPTVIWGGGASVRIAGLRLFSEVKLPLYSSDAFQLGPQSPLVFGVRF